MRIAIILASVAVFLIAAKLHGRELRLEREAMGFTKVVFGGVDNAPAVEALWAAERARFWIGTLSFGVIALASLLIARPSALVWASALLSWAPSASFLVCGALSALRKS